MRLVCAAGGSEGCCLQRSRRARFEIEEQRCLQRAARSLDDNRHVYGKRVPEAGQSTVSAYSLVQAGRQCRAEAVAGVVFRVEARGRGQMMPMNGVRGVFSDTGGDAMGGVGVEVQR